MPPITNQIFSQIGINLLTMLINDKIDNPYLKAALLPLASSFVQGIMNGVDPMTMGQEAGRLIGQGNIDPLTGQTQLNTSQLLGPTQGDYAELYAQSVKNIDVYE